MKNFFLLLLIFFVPIALPAQPTIQWQKTYGGNSIDEAKSIQQTTDGGYIVTGLTASSDGDIFGQHGGADFWVLKLSNNGTIQWKKVLGGTGNEEPFYIQQTVDGGYFVAGYSESNNYDVSGNHGGFSDGWVVKLSPTGAVEWQKTLGGSGWDDVWSAQQTFDQGYILTGRTDSSDGDVTESHGQLDVWVVKLSKAGVIQWQKSLGGSMDDIGYAIKQTTDGGYILAAQTASTDGDVTGLHGNVDFWLVKLSATGGIEWQKTLGGDNGDVANDVIQTDDGGYIVTGHIGSATGDITVHHGITDYWIAKVSPVGDLEWQKSLGGSSAEWARKILPTTDGGYLVAGTTQSTDGDVVGNDGGKEFWLVKVTGQGEFVWQQTYGGTKDEAGYCINHTNDNGFILTGYAWSTDGDLTGSLNRGINDFWVVKLSPDPTTSTTIPSPFTAPIEIYPNPAHQSFSIKIPLEETIQTVTIFDLLGREVLRQNNLDGDSIDISGLATGVYLVRANGVGGQAFWGRVEKI